MFFISSQISLFLQNISSYLMNLNIVEDLLGLGVVIVPCAMNLPSIFKFCSFLVFLQIV